MQWAMLRWYRLVALQMCAGTFQALSPCDSTNIKALQHISAFSAETSGLAAKAIQRNALCGVRRKLELPFWTSMPFAFTMLCLKKFHEFQHGLLLSSDPGQCILAALGSAMCVSGPETWMFLSPGTQLCVIDSFYPSAVADLSCFLTHVVVSRKVCCFFSSFAQLYVVTLLSITDLLKSKLLTYRIVYGIFCLLPSFSGVVRLFLSTECRCPFSTKWDCCWSLKCIWKSAWSRKQLKGLIQRFLWKTRLQTWLRLKRWQS